MKIAFIDLGDVRGELNEPLGIECISSRILREYNIDIDMYWNNMMKFDSYEKLLEYDCVGISMNIGSLPQFEEIYTFMQKNKPELPLILGGCIPTFAYKELIEKYDNIICSYGEGEQTTYEIVTKVINNPPLVIDESLLEIGNLAFKLNGKLEITPAVPLNLDEEKSVIRNGQILNFIKNNFGIVRIEGSRGCSWNRCSFCCVNAKYANPHWRGFPISKILSELIELSRLGFLSPYFTDEDFFGQDYKRAISLGEEIIKLKEQGIINKDMNFFLSIMAADTTVKAGKEALRVLKRAGLREVFLGIESLEKHQLKRYNKKANADVNRSAIEFAQEIGLQIDSGFILFDPNMTFEELGINIDYIKDLQINKIDSRSLKRLRIQPMTAICRTMSNVIVDELDINNLEYKYEFSDEKVGKVYKLYSDWDETNIHNTWRIQAASRGEVNERFRTEIKMILGQIRDIDFQALCYIYDAVAAGNEVEDLEELNALYSDKESLITKAEEIIKKLQ